MKVEAILEAWDQDSVIDKSDLTQASIDTSRMHAKYLRWLFEERLVLRKLEQDLKDLRLRKLEFLTQGHSKETMDLGWQLPARGSVLKSDAGTYADSDPDVVRLYLQAAHQKEKVEVLQEILKMLAVRGYQVKNAIDFQRLMAGG
jgi:Recombination, repair and ssDNA binding protein UvsY